MGIHDPVRPVRLTRVDSGGRHELSDRVAVERALEVRLHGEPFSVIMRTPGDDRSLVAGFLFSEAVIHASADLVTLDDTTPDVVDVRLSDGRAPALADLLGSRRQVTMNASCGMCGRRTLESLDVPGLPLPHTWTLPSAAIAALPGTLAPAQHAFAETGGLHAAGLVTATADLGLESSAEDVGRHNAIDKLVGRMLLTGRLPLTDYVLVVSGRLSFEIVQKAWLAGIPMIVAVSAPSSLAIDLAERAGITLAGFVRDGRFNIYTGPERVAP